MAGYEFEHVEGPPPVRISGRVKWFDAGKGYGFIVPDDPSLTDLKDVLLHVTSLRTSGRESCLEGSLITCDVVRRPKGWQVAEVVLVDETSATPVERRPHDTGRGRDAGPTRCAAVQRGPSPHVRRAGRWPPPGRWRAPR
jgi:CspA family cold shock protein